MDPKTVSPKPLLFKTKAEEAAITKKLDQEAKEDSPAPGLAVQERQHAVVKRNEDDIYTKTAEAICRLRVRKRLGNFKKGN